MKRKSIIYLLMILIATVGVSIAVFSQEQLTITTYYPTPYGIYSKLRLYPQTGANPNGTACANGGELQYYAPNIYYCNSTNWTPLASGTNWWVDTGEGLGNIYNINTGRVGIGTNTPNGHLDVRGISSMGGSVVNLDTSGGSVTGDALYITTHGDTAGVHVIRDTNVLPGLQIDSNGVAVGAPSLQVENTLGTGISTTGAVYGLMAGANGATGIGLQSIGTLWGAKFGDGTVGDGKVYIQDGLGLGLGYSAAAIPADGAIFQGRVGIATNSPLTMLHVRASNATGNYAGMVYSGTIGMIDSTGSPDPPRLAIVKGGGGWEILNFGGTARSDEASVQYNASSHYLSFKTNNTDDQLIIDSLGNVGLGTGAGSLPLAFKFHIYNGDTSYALFGPNNSWGGSLLVGSGINQTGVLSQTAQIRDDNGNLHIDGAGNGGTGDYHVYIATDQQKSIEVGSTLYVNGGVITGTDFANGYTFYVNGGAYSSGWNTSSDIRLKKNITPLKDSLSRVLALQGVNYYWKVKDYPKKNFSSDKQIGLIAQDVEKVIPELVNTDTEGYKAVSYEKLTVVLTEAIKEQQKQIAQLAAQNEALIKREKALKKILEKRS